MLEMGTGVENRRIAESESESDSDSSHVIHNCACTAVVGEDLARVWQVAFSLAEALSPSDASSIGHFRHFSSKHLDLSVSMSGHKVRESSPREY